MYIPYKIRWCLCSCDISKSQDIHAGIRPQLLRATALFIPLPHLRHAVSCILTSSPYASSLLLFYLVCIVLWSAIKTLMATPYFSLPYRLTSLLLIPGS